MYRSYENPYELELQLKELKQQYYDAKVSNADDDILIDLSIEISSLEERINFAWQDDEYENEI
jgi:hypothetical protein